MIDKGQTVSVGWGDWIGSHGQELVVTTKYDGDEENSNKATAARNPDNAPDRNLFLPEDPIADNAAEKKQRDADRDHELSSADR